MSILKKFTIRLDPADVGVLKRAFPDRGYSQAVRAAVHSLARELKQRLERNRVPTE